MPIFLIRHAQSLFNAFGIKKRDIELSDFGIKQAKSLEGHADLVIISPLHRAKQTLENSKITYDNLMISNLCREHNDGNIINYLENEDETIETIETREQLEERMNKFREFLKEQNKIHNTIIVITHALFISNLVATCDIVPNCHILRYK